MKKAKEKVTNKELMNAFNNLAVQFEQLRLHQFNQDNVVSEYISYKEDVELFKAYLAAKFNNDKDNKETEEK